MELIPSSVAVRQKRSQCPFPGYGCTVCSSDAVKTASTKAINSMRFSISCPLLLNYAEKILASQRVNWILSLNWHLMPCPTLAERARLERHSLYQCTIPSVSVGAKSTNSDMELTVSFRVGSIFPTKAASLDLFSVNTCSSCCHFSLKGMNKALISMTRTRKSDVQREEIWNYRSGKFLLILLKTLKSLKDKVIIASWPDTICIH